MEKMASAAGRKAPPVRTLAPDDDLPPEYWQSLLEDARADARSPGLSSGAQGLPVNTAAWINRSVLARCLGRKPIRVSVAWIEICMGTVNSAILSEGTTG